MVWYPDLIPRTAQKTTQYASEQEFLDGRLWGQKHSRPPHCFENSVHVSQKALRPDPRTAHASSVPEAA